MRRVAFGPGALIAEPKIPKQAICRLMTHALANSRGQGQLCVRLQPHAVPAAIFYRRT